MKVANTVYTTLGILTSLSLAAPAPAKNDFSPEKEHAYHNHRRQMAYDYKYVTITVNHDGQTVLGSSKTQLSASPTSSSSSSSPSSSSSSQSQLSSSLSASSLSQASSVTSSSTTLTSSSLSQTSLSFPSSSSSSASLSSPSASSSTSSSSPTSTSGISGDLKAYVNPSEDFEDGKYDCSHFPAGQGVIPLYHLGFGGWSGIENPDKSTGGNCKEGAYCSYACQSGMSKTQWPDNQPSNGVSVGGLYCKGGKLYRTNKNAKTLCEWGEDKAKVESKLSKEVAICRTDYPGTENMVIPTVVEGGSSQPISVMDESTYYKWQGKPTSSQYYVNNAGVSWTDGCQWDSPGSGKGNWAPLNFGSGYSNNQAYLSLIPNPNNKNPLNYNVKIVADGDDSEVSGECAYENGKFKGAGSDGCTVGVTKGKGKFVLYN